MGFDRQDILWRNSLIEVVADEPLPIYEEVRSMGKPRLGRGAGTPNAGSDSHNEPELVPDSVVVRLIDADARVEPADNKRDRQDQTMPQPPFMDSFHNCSSCPGQASVVSKRPQQGSRWPRR